MIEMVLDQVRELAKEFNDEAEKRRSITPTDPTADVFSYCARRIVEKTEEAGDRNAWLTPDQYGAQFIRPVSGVAVRMWIRRGELDAQETPFGYVIHRNARRQKRKTA